MKSFYLWLRPKSFKAWLTYSIGLVISIAILLFTIIYTQQTNKFIRANTLIEANNRTFALAAASRPWVMSSDYVGLEEVIESFLVYDDVIFIAVMNMDGRVIAHTDRSIIGKFISDKRRVKYLQAMSNKVINHEVDGRVLLNNDKVIDMIRVIHQAENHIGFVNIRIDQSKLQENINKIFLQSLIFAFIALVFAFLFSFLTASRFIERLYKLSSVMRKVREGNRTIKANENEVEEVSNLAREFNMMLSTLNESELSNKKTKEQLELAFEGSRDGLWDWNLLDNTIYFSKIWKSMLGYKEGEIIDEFSSWQERVHPDDLEKTLKDIGEHIDGKTELYYNIHRFRHKDGHWIWILDRGKALRDENGKAIRMIGTHTDITVQKAMEEEIKNKDELILAQSRHVAMGEMIGMIAHQWRQPISVIAMGANNMLADIELEEVKEENFKKGALAIIHQTQYLSKTIDDFRNFFRPDKEKEKVILSNLMNETMTLFGKSLENNGIELIINIQEGISVETYSRELLQVLINLLKNAKEALVENTPTNRFIKIDITTKENDVIIRVCDNGGGIDPKIIQRIYEPYFSTKDDKNGTGLGLNMSKIIVEQHLHGSIIATNVEQGVCFKIRIPIVVTENK